MPYPDDSLPNPTRMSIMVEGHCRKIRTMRSYRLVPTKRTPKNPITLTYRMVVAQAQSLADHYRSVRQGQDPFTMTLPYNNDYRTLTANYVAPIRYSYQGMIIQATVALESFDLTPMTHTAVNAALGR